MADFDTQASVYSLSHAVFGATVCGFLLGMLGLFSLLKIFFFGFFIFLIRYFTVLFLAAYFEKQNKQEQELKGGGTTAEKTERKGSHPWDV